MSDQEVVDIPEGPPAGDPYNPVAPEPQEVQPEPVQDAPVEPAAPQEEQPELVTVAYTGPRDNITTPFGAFNKDQDRQVPQEIADRLLLLVNPDDTKAFETR